MTVAFASPQLVGLRRPAPHFQRAINLKYDLNNAAVIAAYVPTTRATDAIARLLRSLTPDSRQRAFLLHGPYGSGKSLLATVLAAILSRDVPPETIAPLLLRFEETAPETAELVRQQLFSGPRLLPVVLNGDEGDLASALLQALFAALRRIGWGEIRLATHYRAALETLDLWQTRYPETYARLGEMLRQDGWSIERLTAGLKRADEQAYDIFQRLYPTLTAGATFNHYGHSVIETYQEAIRALAQEGRYTGVAILWDEFGRFLEAHAGDVFGREAALLQELAEFANHSTESPLHLVLVTHKVIGGYVWNLPPEYIQEWRRIGERFLSLDVSGDPLVAYRLIAAALNTSDEPAWLAYLEEQSAALTQMQAQVIERRLFPELDEAQVRRWVIEGAYPLHPLTVYCLPRLSNQVAQNERTLFTFLTADEPPALRADTGPGGVHPIWAAAEHALRKTPDDENLSRRLIKALAVLQAVGKHPDIATLTFALQTGIEQVEQAARVLARRKVVRQHRLDRTWELMVGSDVDIEAAVRQALERRPPSPIQLRRVLEQTLPPPIYQARQHNIRTGVTRFFWGWYRHTEEISAPDWEAIFKGLDYADGLVIYLLARNAAELAQARALAQGVSSPQVVFVVPTRPLIAVEDLLREFVALSDLKNDPAFREQDARVADELEFFIEDVTARLARALASLIDPWQSSAEWYWQGRRYSVSSPGEVTRLVSHICDTVFPHTPELHNDLINRRTPTAPQIKAAEQVVDVLLTRPPNEQVGVGTPTYPITGFGPACWGFLAFGIPAYRAIGPATDYTLIHRPTQTSPLVPDADVGGTIANQCPGDEYHIWNVWGNRNDGRAPDFNIQNQSDVADWPCFAKYYVTFPLDSIPRGSVIISATLTLHQFGNAGGPGEAQPSWIQVLIASADWREETITWNNAPLAYENIGGSWVGVLSEHPGWPGVPRSWDVSYAVARAYARGEPLRLVLYSADSAYHSGKYFVSSDTGDWNVEGRPRLEVGWK